jgi:hypothetical protein
MEIEEALDLSAGIDDAVQAGLHAEGINCLRAFPSRGIRPWGARTISDDPAWDQVNIRRLFITVSRWIDRLMWDVSFETHDERLWLRITRELNGLLADLFRKGAFQGETAEEAFFVKCDREINTVDVREAGMVVADVGIAPARPGEFIVIRVAQSDTGTTITPSTQFPATTTTRMSVVLRSVSIAGIVASPAGPDIEGEYVLIRNDGGRSVELTNWKLRDRAGHEYLFPRAFLDPGGKLRVWTGTGFDTATDQYWGLGTAVWNNTGDTALLYDSQDHLLSTFVYQGEQKNQGSRV